MKITIEVDEVTNNVAIQTEPQLPIEVAAYWLHRSAYAITSAPRPSSSGIAVAHAIPAGLKLHNRVNGENGHGV